MDNFSFPEHGTSGDRSFRSDQSECVSKKNIKPNPADLRRCTSEPSLSRRYLLDIINIEKGSLHSHKQRSVDLQSPSEWPSTKRSCNSQRQPVISALQNHEHSHWKKDACYVNHDQELDEVLNQCRTNHPDAFITLISAPSDIYEDNLLAQIHYQEGKETALPGRLFSDEKVILVINARGMSAGDLAGLNELYDQPPRLRGEKLGPNVRIMTLVSEEMKPKPGEKNEGKPGNDFWRRINKAWNRWQLAQNSQPSPESGIDLSHSHLGLSSFSVEQSGHQDLTDQNQVVLDFLGSSDWRNVLLGYPKKDDKTGQVHYQHSLLSNARGKTIILKMPPGITGIFGYVWPNYWTLQL